MALKHSYNFSTRLELPPLCLYHQEAICIESLQIRKSSAFMLLLLWWIRWTLSLVRECRELEERYRSNFTSQILNAKEYPDMLEKHKNTLTRKMKSCCWIKFQAISTFIRSLSVPIGSCEILHSIMAPQLSKV